jgi:hypothetical protein
MLLCVSTNRLGFRRILCFFGIAFLVTFATVYVNIGRVVFSLRNVATDVKHRRESQCQQNILAASDPMVGEHSRVCPMVIPSVVDICKLNRIAKQANPPPVNASEFCSHTKRAFASLKSREISKHTPNPGQCSPGDAAIEVFCDTRLDVYFFHWNYTAMGFRKSTLDVKEALFETPMKRMDEAELRRMPTSTEGARILCVSPHFKAVQLSCRRRNFGWYLPDFISELRTPPSIFTLTRYGKKVGWLEYVCNLWVNGHSLNCYDDFNIVPLTAFPTLRRTLKKHQPKGGDFFRHKTTGARMNVVAMQFDSLSRYQAISEMPLFQSFVRKRLMKKQHTEHIKGQWVVLDFANHNAYADDTFPNLFAAFVGAYIYHLKTSPNIAAEDLKPGPWWLHAKKNQFTTFYGCMMDTQGLAFSPKNLFDFSSVYAAADVMYREPLSDNRGVYGYEPYEGPAYSKHCMGGKPAVKQMLDYFLHFTQTCRREKLPFAAQIENEDLHNSNLLNAKMVDEPLATFLEQMERDGGGEDTILIINADHGARYGGGIDADKLLHLYNSNPMLRVFVPPSIAEDFYSILANNQRRITAALDIYATLRELVGGTKELEYRLDRKHDGWVPPITPSSIFRELPVNRSCADCGIPLSRCTCKLGLKTMVFSLRRNDRIVPKKYQNILKKLISTALQQLKFMGAVGKIPGCKVPHLKEVISLEEQTPPLDMLDDDGEAYIFQVYFKLVEGPNAVFKATIPAYVKTSKTESGTARSFYIPDNLVGSVKPGTESGQGHRGNYIIGLDRTTKMLKDCKSVVESGAPTEALKKTEHMFCLC